MGKIDFDKFVEGMRETCRPDTQEELLGEFLVAKQVLSNVLVMLDIKKSKAAEEGDDEGVKMALEGAMYVMGVMCLLGEDIENLKAEWLGKEAEGPKLVD